MGLGTGLRLWPVARLAIGACAAQWAGLRVAGKSVLELGCGCGAVGLACAALGQLRGGHAVKLLFTALSSALS